MEDSYIELSKYFKKDALDIFDFLSVLFVAVSSIIVAKIATRKHHRDPAYRKYFMPGLLIKMSGGLAYALVYTFYYTYGGDTSGFWRYGAEVTVIFFERPEEWWDVFSRNFQTSSSFALDQLESMQFARSMEEYRMVQITSILAPLGLMNFYANSVLIAAICYTGVWRLFLTFRAYFPQVEKQLAISVLFIPSVFFWASGIMKDTVVFACVGLIVYSTHKLMKDGIWQIKHLLVISLAIFLAGSIKAYVLFCLAPGIIVWRIFRYRDKIKSKTLQRIALPLFMTIAMGLGFATIDFVGRYNPQYALNNFISGAQSMQNWHYQEGRNTSEQYGRGSSYTLGEYEPTTLGVLKKAPAAINVALFRPYPWEIDTFMQLLAALESFIFLALTIYIMIFYAGPRKAINVLGSDAFLIMMVSFTLLFAFGVGFSAYNFGALARYKIPCVPFFAATLFIVRYKLKEQRLVKRIRVSERQRQLLALSNP